MAVMHQLEHCGQGVILCYITHITRVGLCEVFRRKKGYVRSGLCEVILCYIGGYIRFILFNLLILTENSLENTGELGDRISSSLGR